MVSARTALLGPMSSFDPLRGRIDTDWSLLSDLAEANGLAPLASYNLEYRLGGAGAPQEIRDRLMALYQGTLNDNVFKLVTLKRALSELETAPVMLLDAAAVADSAYPHVAFRPVPEVRLGTRAGELAAVQGALASAGFRPDPTTAGAFTDGRIRIPADTQLAPNETEDAGIWGRSLPAPAYGATARRPGLEDAILLAVSTLVRETFSVPLIQYVDLRELLKGAPATGVVYTAPPDAAVLTARAAAWGLSRSLYATLAILSSFFPHDSATFAALSPRIGVAAQALVDQLIVKPVVESAGSDVPKLSGFGRALIDT